MTISIEELATFCKKKGFVYPSSEIYGGIAGFFDLGPLGVELFNNLKAHWWKHFVQCHENMVGMQASVISHPRVWKASGHLDSFGDMMVYCTNHKQYYRADQLAEEILEVNADGMDAQQLSRLLKKHHDDFKKAGYDLNDEMSSFNLMFKTTVGPKADTSSVAYLRGETAQGMFTDFKLIAETTRQNVPFGIAQIGTCFRNEIAPRDFMFRSREFTIAEFEFFIHPDAKKCEQLTSKQRGLKLMFLDAEAQNKGKATLKEVTIKDLIAKKKLDEWHAFWLAEQLRWLYSIGLKKDDLKVREHTKNELSHYSSATFDIDFQFPFGSKELAGNANRGQFDLTQHIKESGEKLELFDEESKQKIIPRVIEPTFGMERAFLAVMVDAFNDDKKRGNIVLKLKPELAPIKVGVFPLVRNKSAVVKLARKIYDELKSHVACQYDESGSIGRRYARADEIGVPFCVTVDFDSLHDKKVTVRSRDTTQQIRASIKDLNAILQKLLNGEKLPSFGKIIT